MLDLAKASKDGQLYTCLSALVMSAFMLEAYLNHLGGLKFKDWDARERTLSKLKKFRTFAAQSGIKLNFTERPHKSLVTLFAYRDSMAHGKTVTEEIDAEIDIDSSIATSIPSAGWQQFATLETAEELLTDAVAIIRQLHTTSGYHDDPFGSSGGGLYAISHTEG
ncbi:hypothetical protein [Burkholderia cenocepacia]|uniref:hypothetical protein n=1 Tax=Burkholderia cenocepacia TaxID=95486 RepID=UPI00287653D8|nr:hypothetical protein [Burkholderia cenocepacia]MDS0850435.1 hypothetical protein [Burkholderia cenocepacia]